MAAVTPCVPCCTTPQTVGIPGPQGEQGPPGVGTVTEVTASDGFLAVADGTTTPDLTVDGTLGLDHGGTGGTDAASAFSNIMTGNIILVANGGTGANSEAGARTSLDVQRLVPDPIFVEGSGTHYTLTNTPAFVNLGTTDPVLTLTRAGWWMITYEVAVDNFGANTNANTAGHLFTAYLYDSTNAVVAPNSYGYARSGDIDRNTGSSYGQDVFRVTKIFFFESTTGNEVLQMYASYSLAPDSGAWYVSIANIYGIWLRE